MMTLQVTRDRSTNSRDFPGSRGARVGPSISEQPLDRLDRRPERIGLSESIPFVEKLQIRPRSLRQANSIDRSRHRLFLSIRSSLSRPILRGKSPPLHEKGTRRTKAARVPQE